MQKGKGSSELHIQVMSCVAQYDAVQSSIILSHDILHQCLSSNNEWWPSYRHLFCYMSCKNTLTNPNTSRFAEVDLVCETNIIPSSNFNKNLCGSIYHVFRWCGYLILVQPNFSFILKNKFAMITYQIFLNFLVASSSLLTLLDFSWTRMHMYISFQVE